MRSEGDILSEESEEDKVRFADDEARLDGCRTEGVRNVGPVCNRRWTLSSRRVWCIRNARAEFGRVREGLTACKGISQLVPTARWANFMTLNKVSCQMHTEVMHEAGTKACTHPSGSGRTQETMAVRGRELERTQLDELTRLRSAARRYLDPSDFSYEFPFRLVLRNGSHSDES
jgi:hypothetical protein